MQTQFEFDAEGVFDQPIKPFRFKKRSRQHIKRKLFIPMTNGAKLDSQRIREVSGLSRRASDISDRFKSGQLLVESLKPRTVPPAPSVQQDLVVDSVTAWRASLSLFRIDAAEEFHDNYNFNLRGDKMKPRRLKYSDFITGPRNSCTI